MTSDAGDGAAPARPDGRRTRWDAHRAERRRQVVEAAVAVLGEVGPDFGLDQVAERAGVTKPVIYRHFTDRRGLVEAIGEWAVHVVLEERMLPLLRRADAPRARLHVCIDAFLAFFEEHPNIYWIFVSPAASDPQDVAPTVRELIAATIVGELGAFLRAGGADEGTAAIWGRGLVGFVQNVAEWWLETRTLPRTAVTDELVGLLWAQIDGVARRHGLALDPDEHLDPDDIARKVAERDGAR